ncbi:cytochrome P450 [Herbihabitans rhizosphaerae]|uniref:Cytochrome P450 n=1 Tax=Herbihabitans rhizosphaerae TaxID=1872711 RepID=A0A4Q7KLL2_9PSEU|nr:cytochrome P450 [Herbihabitans rhizosphaerae]RZS34836.1 cytochrome P450 [Herbihabitans rhizosphaerae]
MTVTDSAFPEYDLFTPEAMNNPMPLLHRIRAETPIAWISQLDAGLLTRHADIVAVLRDRRMATANLTQGLRRLSPAELDELLPLRTSVERWMGHTTHSDHLRFQKLLRGYFTPAVIDRLRPRVREFTDELLDAVEPHGRLDLVAELAYPLPALVIAEMLGMPTSRREQLQAWSKDITAIFQITGFDQLRQCQRSVLEMQDYMRELVDERRRLPREDLISMFVAAEKDGLVDEEEIVSNCVLLLFAGHETTGGLISNGMVQLFENPDQLDLLKSDPDLMPGAIEEMLRITGPASVISRVSTETVEVAGHTFPAGRQFFLAMNAGNRDPDVFADPDRFDITRQSKKHTAFGTGVFYCLGAALARMEADECFRILLSRFPDIRPAYQEPDWRPVILLGRRLDTLPVQL